MKYDPKMHKWILFWLLIPGVESKLLKARMKMQQKYLDQFYMLYDDFNITKLPLLPQEVHDSLLVIGLHFLE